LSQIVHAFRPVAASLLKVRHWSVDPFAASDVPPLPVHRIAIGNFELELGLWLLSGWFARVAWVLTIATFMVT
jgi:hypothetical protein